MLEAYGMFYLTTNFFSTPIRNFAPHLLLFLKLDQSDYRFCMYYHDNHNVMHYY